MSLAEIERKKQYHRNMAEQFDRVLFHVKNIGGEMELLPNDYVKVIYNGEPKIVISVNETHFIIVEYLNGMPYAKQIGEFGLGNALWDLVKKWKS
jgi:hypothetical protein